MRKFDYMKNILASLFILISFINYGQYECATADSVEAEPKTQSFCNDPNNNLDNYLLDKLGINNYDQSPKYTVNLKVHIMQYSLSDPRNYTYNDSVKIRELIEEVNNYFSNIQPPTIPVINSTLEETDTRVRFHLDTIDFIQDTIGWEISSTSSTQVNYGFSIIDTNKIVFSGFINPTMLCIEIVNSNSNDGVYKIIDNIFSNGSTTLTIGSSFSDVNDQSGIIFRINRSFGNNFYSFNKYHKTDSSAIHIYYVRNDDDCYQVGFGQAKGYGSNALIMVNPGSSPIQLNNVSSGEVGLLAHELGHCLGLRHTMYPQTPSYIDDIFQPDENEAWKPCNDSTISNNIMGYNTCRTYLSPLQIAEIHRYVNNYKVLKNTILETYSSTNNDVYITESDVTWEDRKIIGSTLYIEPGAKLTIKCKVHFSSEGRVVIKPGGELVVDGGLLTNDYNEFWQGIQVYGTTHQHQYPSNHPTYQGMLILKNGGTIENAHKAVTNWHQDHWGEIGGVIQSTDGIFRNNRRDIEFMSYSNHLPNNPNIKVPNISFFKNTDFVTDDNFIEKGLAQQTHVTLWEVHGIEFTNCHFSNNITTNKSLSSAPKQAIYALNASFAIGAGCSNPSPIGQPCASSNLLKSSFTGFEYAVQIAGAASSKTATISQADFANNFVGISVDEYDNVSINRNEFELGDTGYGWFPAGAGVVTNNSKDFIIEENTVSTSLMSGYYWGIMVNNSGANNNRLYKNTLRNLLGGTIVSGINHNPNYQKGLQFLCNKYEDNITAIRINSSPITDGVRFYQGDYSPNKSAGNTFVNNNLDIENNANSIVYYYKGSNSLPINNSGLITVYQAAYTNNCPTSYGGGITMFTNTIDSLSIVYNNLNVTYTNLYFNYLSLIDGGNTEFLQNQVETNWSNDAWLLRGKLIEESPYLSSEALLTAANQNVLPNGMLLEVLLANPEATRGGVFIEKLREATNNSFPEYMIDYVINNYDNKTLRTTLEGQMSSVDSELSSTRNYIKHLKKSQGEYTYADRLNTVKMGSSLSDKIGLIDFYIENSQFGKADSVLQEMYNNEKMKNEIMLVENYDSYLLFRSELDERNLAQLDSIEINYLQTLAENTGRVAGYAQNILCFFYDICYDKEILNGNSQPKSMVASSSTPELVDILYSITVYPNPANDFTSIKWEIYDELKDAQYKIYDMNGREMGSGIIEENKGEKIIDTRSLDNGVYIINIYNDGVMKMNSKLIVSNEK